MPDSISIPVTQHSSLTLSAIHSPDDLKKLTLAELQRVADECRTEVIDLVSVNLISRKKCSHDRYNSIK